MALSKYKHADHFNTLHDKKADKQLPIEDAAVKKEVVKMMDTTETLKPEISKESDVKVEKTVTAKKPEPKTATKKTDTKPTKSNK
jgi:hypothetical protein